MQNQVKNPDYKRKRTVLLIIIIILIPIGFAMKLYPGSGNSFLNNKLVDLVYVVFWSMVVAVLFMKKSPFLVVLSVFIITCALEFLQLYSNPLLEIIRSTFLGRSLIGNSFSWSDFIYYTLGSILSFIWLRRINNSTLHSDYSK